MGKRIQQATKPLLKSLFALFLVLTLAFSHGGDALAARTGGRIGGGSFRAPTSRTYSSPRSYAPGGYGGGYYPGGGFGFPFLLPLWGFGGGFGSLFSILIFMAIANFIFQTFRRANGGEVLEDTTYSSNPTVSISRLQVGLLANARSLQTELNAIAASADTNSSQGRTEILQETSLALLRHPEYWAYADGGTQQARLSAAEADFNRLSLAERSKFTAETLSNVNNQLKEVTPQAALTATAELENAAPGEYIVVTILAATLGKQAIPAINTADDLRQALRQIGSISGDNLLAIEVLWAPQADGDTLSSDDLLTEYTNLKMV
ncbi:DUF1517 domain-containing protein [Calothrix sp. 336/3]|uniref:DUF1517 domain-containing protein n=1 Tax=Calothrix sp. 336/3 TaxID=1337936 RepID=UPI0004E2D8B2|nr:DUF1517 domain-containing protein [Calothrix sp. 336/3]AKG19916.1 membrane protein [Calothrix sp. 336/3]